jgi:hypothetical protein
MSYTFRGFTINDFMLRRLKAYVEHGECVGQFLTAVLENKLCEAVGLADENNLHNLPAYVGYLCNQAPQGCWGSPERVKAWLELSKSKFHFNAENSTENHHENI